ncbi:UDP-glucose 4-epimerase-like [Ischnura elegans]|uniref:UDP-glucose 4-epimerase-like n=1 Tax=Ischnura elegans TaxID=197161 RepID=UPI001ED893D2|nr:UDP-glucose 4-epimerase-like [Ischnura elegans]
MDRVEGTSEPHREWKTIFVTGGAGYIGSHCILTLLEAGYTVVTVDNFTNAVGIVKDGHSCVAPSIQRVEQITGKKVIFHHCDLLDKKKLSEVFAEQKIDCVIHFAAMKAVGESMQVPFLYYKNNIMGTINLLEVMAENNCHEFVFSSSCTVYGDPGDALPITEEHPTGGVTNVYGRTKFFIEEMLKDIYNADKRWNIVLLRYFNPVGAHPSGIIGEDPTKPFANLMPYMAQVAIGTKPSLTIFGTDYETEDGTGVRDYIHIMDLAEGHVAALSKLKREPSLGLKAYNLGTGKGVTVLQLVHTFERVTGTTLTLDLKDRREGDIVAMYADPSLAEKELGWTAKRSIEEMCRDFWKWQTQNPTGYRGDVSHMIPAAKSNLSESATVSLTNGNHSAVNGH